LKLQPAVVVILGPTAVGKTHLSLEIASRLKGEIVSVDSRLIYRGMDIGTAKPTLEQRQRVPHHMIDIADPDEDWSLARFRQVALEVIEAVHGRGHLPLMVGGTGQYITAILEGWNPPPKPSDATLRKELESFAAKQGRAALHKRLEKVDPVAAKRIHENNLRRVIRALEIYHATGIPSSELRKKEPPAFRSLRVGLTLPREILYERIDTRIDEMIQAGFQAEVERLLEQGYAPELPSMSAIGYEQMARVISQEISLEDAVIEMRRLTRQFVRRQANWFKPDDPQIHWFDMRQEDVQDSIRDLILDWLRKGG
jgi:tRNA dimethylallyltransferase